MIISRETLRASQVDNFDQLAIPFRAVAGDIVTGEAVVLGSGSLARAIRASMSIPAALSPIEIDGRLLVDGGIVMNLPVDVAREMGADVVIAVDISSELLGRETLRSVLDVTSQLTNMLTRNGTLQQRAKLTSNDVLLVPTFGDDLTSMDFARMRETIQTGYDTVMQNRAEFERLALTEEEYDAYRRCAPRSAHERACRSSSSCASTTDGPVADSVVEARLGAIELGEPLDVDAVERAMNTVYGLDYYQNVRYGLVNDSRATGIELELDARSWGPNYLQLGMEYSSAADSDSLFGLAASYLSTAINPLGGEWRATVVIGDEPALVADLYQPFGAEGALFLRAVAVSRVDAVQRLRGRRAHHGSAAARGDARVRRRARAPDLGRVPVRRARRQGRVRSARRRSDADLRGRVSARRVLRPLLGRHDGQRLVSARGVAALARMARVAAAACSRPTPTSISCLLAASYAKTWGRHTVLTTLR